MNRRLKFVLIAVLLLMLGGMAIREYFAFRVSNPLAFHVEQVTMPDGGKSPVTRLRVENSTAFPVRLYFGSLNFPSSPDGNPALHYFNSWSRHPESTILVPGGGVVLLDDDEMHLHLIRSAQRGNIMLRYTWSPSREAWYRHTAVPCLQRWLPKAWSDRLPQSRVRRSYQMLRVSDGALEPS